MVENGKADEGLYTLFPSCGPASLQSNQSSILHSSPPVEAQIWHSRLSHPSNLVLNKMSIIPSVGPSIFTTCDVCLQAKQRRLPFSSSTRDSYSLFDLIHCDLWGPY